VRWHSFPATNNGSPMGSIPVFLINQHRIDNVADAEAYVARLRDTERALGEIAGNIRTQTTMGITPARIQLRPGAGGRAARAGRRAVQGGQGHAGLRRLQDQGREA
jgi:uncharacterized protein (DUF885 family)